MVHDGIYHAEMPPEDPSKIPHYYGDYVRQLFLAIAAILVVVIPIWKDFLPVNILIEISAIVALVILAGLTNPSKKWTIVFDTVLAALGVVAFETAAVSMWSGTSFFLFGMREVVSLLFLFALYFSIKTLRSMPLDV